MGFKKILILRLTLWILENEVNLRFLQKNEFRYYKNSLINTEGLNHLELNHLIDVKNQYNNPYRMNLELYLIYALILLYSKEISFELISKLKGGLSK